MTHEEGKITFKGNKEGDVIRSVQYIPTELLDFIFGNYEQCCNIVKNFIDLLGLKQTIQIG